MNIPVKSVRFRAGFIRDGKYTAPLSEFRLGPGPCGKTVEDLQATLTEGALTISQVCEDGEVKAFIYPLTQLTGRIEVTVAD